MGAKRSCIRYSPNLLFSLPAATATAATASSSHYYYSKRLFATDEQDGAIVLLPLFHERWSTASDAVLGPRNAIVLHLLQRARSLCTFNNISRSQSIFSDSQALTHVQQNNMLNSSIYDIHHKRRRWVQL